MGESRFDLVCRGQIAEGARLETVKKKLAAKFGMNEKVLSTLFSGKTVKIKKDVNQATAEKIKRKFEEAGAVCHMVSRSETQENCRKFNVPPKCENDGSVRVVTPVRSEQANLFSPRICHRIAAGAEDRGITFQASETIDVDFEDIRLISAFLSENDLFLAVFVREQKRPYQVDAIKIDFSGFENVKSSILLNSTRNFIRCLLRKNPAILVDASTFAFFSGKQPKAPEMGIGLWFGALGTALEAVESGKGDVGIAREKIPAHPSPPGSLEKVLPGETGTMDHPDAEMASMMVPFSSYCRGSLLLFILLCGIVSLFGIGTAKMILVGLPAFAAVYLFWLAMYLFFMRSDPLFSEKESEDLGNMADAFEAYGDVSFTLSILQRTSKFLSIFPLFVARLGDAFSGLGNYVLAVLMVLGASGTIYYFSPAREKALKDMEIRKALVSEMIVGNAKRRLLELRGFMWTIYEKVNEEEEAFPRTMDDVVALIVKHGDGESLEYVFAEFFRNYSPDLRESKEMDEKRRKLLGKVLTDPWNGSKPILFNQDPNSQYLIPDHEFRLAGPDGEYDTEDDFVLEFADDHLEPNFPEEP